jgi:hypothetical protein
VEIVLARIFISHKFAPVARGFPAWKTPVRIDKAAVWLNFLAVKRISRAHLAFGGGYVAPIPRTTKLKFGHTNLTSRNLFKNKKSERRLNVQSAR